ncbi:helix-turn-helix domain-containing protein [Spirosoma gilvum]
MESRPLTFDQVPDFLYQLGCKVDDLTALLKTQAGLPQPPADRWLNIKELSDYLPGKPAITTIYGKVQRREIPFFREGKNLFFLQSQIDLWLASKRSKTALELAEVAERQTVRLRRGGRQKV